MVFVAKKLVPAKPSFNDKVHDLILLTRFNKDFIALIIVLKNSLVGERKGEQMEVAKYRAFTQWADY